LGACREHTATTIDFTSFLKLMAHQRASDLFITAGMLPAMKVNGKISPITQTPLTPQQSRDLVLNVMTPAQREEFEKTHVRFAIGLSGVGRFRVSCFYQRNQVGMVLRRIETHSDRGRTEPAADHQDAGDDQARHHPVRRRHRYR
jgi:twitching motility protein PilU